VFFKLKRSSQTSLEGVHGLSVTFIAPAAWRGGDVSLACSARGRRKVLWIKQPATLGGETATVRLRLTEISPVYHVAKPVAIVMPSTARWASSRATAAKSDKAAGADDGVNDKPTKKKSDAVLEDGATAGL
jgi:hypothetical protein